MRKCCLSLRSPSKTKHHLHSCLVFWGCFQTSSSWHHTAVLKHLKTMWVDKAYDHHFMQLSQISQSVNSCTTFFLISLAIWVASLNNNVTATFCFCSLFSWIDVNVRRVSVHIHEHFSLFLSICHQTVDSQLWTAHRLKTRDFFDMFRATCQIIMLLSRRLDTPHLSGAKIIMVKERSSLTWIIAAQHLRKISFFVHTEKVLDVLLELWELGAKSELLCSYFQN